MNIISGEQALVELSKHSLVFYKDGLGIWCVVDSCMDLSNFLKTPDWMTFGLKPEYKEITRQEALDLCFSGSKKVIAKTNSCSYNIDRNSTLAMIDQATYFGVEIDINDCVNLPKPFNPEKGEKYWLFSTDGAIRHVRYDSVFDKDVSNFSGCYKTEEDAEKARELIRSFVQGGFK